MKHPIDLDLTAPERRYLERVAPKYWREAFLAASVTVSVAMATGSLWILAVGPPLIALIAVLDRREYRLRETAIFARVERRAAGRPADAPLPDDPHESRSAKVMLIAGSLLLPAGVVLDILGAGEATVATTAVVAVLLIAAGFIDPGRRAQQFRS